MLIAAAIVLVVLALLHSLLGELLIFRHLPKMTGLPTLGFPPVAGAAEPPHNTLRATWHTPTLLALPLALLLFRYATIPLTPNDRFALQTIAAALFATAFLWCAATRAKHIGWLGFLLAATLTWLGSR